MFPLIFLLISAYVNIPPLEESLENSPAYEEAITITFSFFEVIAASIIFAAKQESLIIIVVLGTLSF